MSVGLERESIMPDLYSGLREASWRGIAHNTFALAAGLRCKLQRCLQQQTFGLGFCHYEWVKSPSEWKRQTEDGIGIDRTC